MARSKKRQRLIRRALTESEAPFVPDYDLLERLKKQPSPAEISAIGAALLSLAPPPDVEVRTPWLINSRISALSRRL